MKGLRQDERILISAPSGADAHNLSLVLGEANILTGACPDIAAVAAEIPRGCGAILLTEEALYHAPRDGLMTALSNQAPWSDIPLMLIVSSGRVHAAGADVERTLGARANVTLIERPVRAASLLSSIHAALRARRRQYEVWDLLRQRDELLANLERRVAERTAKLEEMNAESEAFSYSVSHDLRAPLRAIESYARILCEEYTDFLPEDGQLYASRIAKSAHKMDRLTRDILTLARLSRCEVPLEPLDLDHVLQEVIDQYPDLTAAAGHIKITYPLGRVMGHAASLMQCLSNLLQNALKFIPTGRTPQLRVFSEARGQRLRLWVQDNGIGIDPLFHQRIFGMFERASPADVPGTGIGLAIAKKATERMGGSIGVDSPSGEGARFWIELAVAAHADLARAS
jgi:signal transduction histidine kinase